MATADRCVAPPKEAPVAPVAPVARHLSRSNQVIFPTENSCLRADFWRYFGCILLVLKISPKVVLLSYYISYNRWVYFVVLLSYCMYNHPDFLREIRT